MDESHTFPYVFSHHGLDHTRKPVKPVVFPRVIATMVTKYMRKRMTPIHHNISAAHRLRDLRFTMRCARVPFCVDKRSVTQTKSPQLVRTVSGFAGSDI